MDNIWKKNGQIRIPLAVTIRSHFLGKPQQMLQSLIYSQIYPKKGCLALIPYISHSGILRARLTEVDSIRTTSK